MKRTWEVKLPSRDGHARVLIATARYDDECHNGHNTFAITGEEYESGSGPRHEARIERNGKNLILRSCGCLHEQIAKHVPELAPLLRWHLTGDDGPLHYVENTAYWAGHRGYCDGKPGSPPNSDHLRACCVFGAVPEFDNGVSVEHLGESLLLSWLLERKEALMAAFRADLAMIGFTAEVPAHAS